MERQMRIYYDEEGDFLEIMFGEPREDYGDYISEDVFLYRDEKTDEVIGIGIFNFKSRAKSLKDIEVELPIKVSLEKIKM